jgi:hypothetical protein
MGVLQMLVNNAQSVPRISRAQVSYIPGANVLQLTLIWSQGQYTEFHTDDGCNKFFRNIVHIVLHGAISQKMTTFITAAVRASNPTLVISFHLSTLQYLENR